MNHERHDCREDDSILEPGEQDPWGEQDP